MKRDHLLLAVIAAIVLLVGWRAPVFLTGRNALDIANESALLAILVAGQVVVLLTRGVDLSVASNLALTGMACALVGKALPGTPIGVLLLLAITIGGLLGALNGVLIAHAGLPPIVVTLGTMSLYRGAVFVASGGAWVSEQDIHAAIKSLPRTDLLGVPLLIVIAAVVVIAMAAWLRWRPAGREVIALGNNPGAAAVAGIPQRRRLMQVYVLSGALAGLAGVLWVGRYAIAFTELAAGYELTVIAACVIGGVSIAGGIGTVGGAMLGVLFIGVVNAALPVIHVSPFWQQAIAGAVILLSVAFNAKARAAKGLPILERPSA
ncbi:ABC transporter permease [Roseateles asaccharophilus]|uniref:Autoinducer 2 import system permease protein LsrC n=1 Tax=Roseateles asaccharophilus TaxID=582607 RepID=A0ABU2A9V7_9BURK|nr:ABC transporter permease [Roseateles asaccharophilus]MDR7333989.1 rhamnose transport system permease protein [Roseateles asaccharophilus]